MGDIKKRSADDFPLESQAFLVRHRFRDVDELAQVGRAWDLDFRQVSRGPFEGEVVQWGSQRVQLARGSLGGRLHQRGSTPAGHRTFAIPATRDIRLFWRGRDIGPDQIMIFPRSRELDCASHPDFDMFTVSVTEDDLDDAAEHAELPSLDRFLAGREVVVCDREHLSRMRRWLAHLLQEASETRLVATPERTAQALIQLVASSMAGAAPDGAGNSEGVGVPHDLPRDAVIRRALSMISSPEPRISTVKDLAHAAGCSERTLRRAFHERFGVGPKTYMLSQRLTGVRRELRRSDPQNAIIVDIANRWGFWHMGQFAADYRLFFGELPSTTLGRRA
jgi:AraC family ethanolamine operon transcriptional activator